MTTPIDTPFASDRDDVVVERDDRGRVLPGNQLAVKSGAWSKVRTLPVDILTWRNQLIADQGGDAELQGQTLRASYIRRISVVEHQIRRIEQRIAGTKTDRLADRTFDRYMALLKQWDSLAQRIGVERRAKRLTTFNDFLKGTGHAPGNHDASEQPE